MARPGRHEQGTADGKQSTWTINAEPEAEPRQVACREHEGHDLAIIRAQCSEVRLEPSRETHGHGQGSGLSGEAESRGAGFRFAPFAAAN